MNRRIQFLQLDPGVFGCEAPVNERGAMISLEMPGLNPAALDLQVRDPANEGLTGEHAELQSGHVEPAALLVRVVNFQLVDLTSRLCRQECGVQLSDAVRVQVVHHKHVALGFREVQIHQGLHILCAVPLGLFFVSLGYMDRTWLTPELTVKSRNNHRLSIHDLAHLIS